MSGEKPKNFFYRLEWSALVSVISIILLFSGSIIVTVIAPNYVEREWIEPSSPYQVQMYEVSDPNFYISSGSQGANDLQFVYHLKNDYTLLAFQDSATVKVLAPPELEKYVTRQNDPHLKLTSRLLMLRKPADKEKAQTMVKDLQNKWEQAHPNWKEKKLTPINYIIMEIYDPKVEEAFAVGQTDGILDNWIDKDKYELLEGPKQKYHTMHGVIYVSNPTLYRYKVKKYDGLASWFYDPDGQEIKSYQELTSPPLAFISRKDLIREGEDVYRIEGCWYCHTDQTRTLIQDVVLNGAPNFPAPPSSPNEYIYQHITFPGTKRNRPDLSRVAIKRPSRDWHRAHFWAPRTQSAGSIMPSFRHFFDAHPRETNPAVPGVPNRQFEGIYQYLMTKGTRITPPTQAWWLGLDPVQTIDIIEGRKTVK